MTWPCGKEEEEEDEDDEEEEELEARLEYRYILQVEKPCRKGNKKGG